MDDQNQTISDCWWQFVRDNGLANAPDAQLRAIRRAFHGGALSVFLLLDQIPDDLEVPEDEVSHYVASLRNELADWGEDIAEGRA
jgi:hypothetical protein